VFQYLPIIDLYNYSDVVSAAALGKAKVNTSSAPPPKKKFPKFPLSEIWVQFTTVETAI